MYDLQICLTHTTQPPKQLKYQLPTNIQTANARVLKKPLGTASSGEGPSTPKWHFGGSGLAQVGSWIAASWSLAKWGDDSSSHGWQTLHMCSHPAEYMHASDCAPYSWSWYSLVDRFFLVSQTNMFLVWFLYRANIARNSSTGFQIKWLQQSSKRVIHHKFIMLTSACIVCCNDYAGNCAPEMGNCSGTVWL